MTEKKNEIAVAKNISEAVLAKVQTMQETGGLVLPEDYHAGNALNAAYLKFKQLEDKNHKPAEQVCSKESVALALMDMVIQGLSPAKNQCYFVVHGNQLTLMRSYMGTVAAAKRFGGVKDVFAQVIYKGDEFKMEVDPSTGKRRVTRHGQTFESIEEGTIRGAYATVTLRDGSVYQEIMTIDEIRKAWAQGSAYGSKAKTHEKFGQEMAKKTVINRACKLFINTSTDSSELAEAFNRGTASEHEVETDGPIIDVPTEDIKTAAFNELFEDDNEIAGEPAAPAEDLSAEAEAAFSEAGEEANA